MNIALTNIDVIGTNFYKCRAPCVLTMRERVDGCGFLPLMQQLIILDIESWSDCPTIPTILRVAPCVGFFIAGHLTPCGLCQGTEYFLFASRKQASKLDEIHLSTRSVVASKLSVGAVAELVFGKPKWYCPSLASRS